VMIFTKLCMSTLLCFTYANLVGYKSLYYSSYCSFTLYAVWTWKKIKCGEKYSRIHVQEEEIMYNLCPAAPRPTILKVHLQIREVISQERLPQQVVHS